MNEKHGNREEFSLAWYGGISYPNDESYRDEQVPPYSLDHTYVPYGSAKSKPEKGYSEQPHQNIYDQNLYPPPKVGGDGNFYNENYVEDPNSSVPNERKLNDVFGIIIPILFAFLYAFSTYRIIKNSNSNASPLWEFYSAYSLGYGPLKLGINPYVSLIIIPIITLFITQVSSFVFNRNLKPRKVKFLALLTIMSIFSPIVIAIAIFSSFNYRSGYGLTFSMILFLLLLFIGYLIYKFMSKNAVIISEFVNVSYKGLHASYASLIPTISSILLSTTLVLFTYPTLIKGILYTPFQLYAVSNNTTEMIIISNTEDYYHYLFETYHKKGGLNPEHFFEYTKYFGKSDSYLESSFLNVFLLIISALYLCLFIYQFSTSVITGYVATFLLNSDQGVAIDDKHIAPKSRPVINSAKNALTINIGSVALFTLVRFIVSIIETIFYLFRIAISEDSNNSITGVLLVNVIHYIVGIINEIIIAINTYATVLNSIYGHKFSKCYSHATKNVKDYAHGLINTYYSYTWYLRFNFQVGLWLSLLIHYFLTFLLSYTASSLLNGDLKSFRRELCVAPNVLNDRLTHKNFGLPNLPSNYDYNICSTLGIWDAAILPILISITFTSTLFILYFHDCCNSILGCLVELPSIASHMSEQLSIYANNVFCTNLPNNNNRNYYNTPH